MLYVRYVFESSPLNTVSERTATRESATSGWVWESSLGERIDSFANDPSLLLTSILS